MTQRDHHIPEEDSLTLLQFYADWCQPCRMMMPMVDSIKQRQLDWLAVRQIDVDEESAIANQYHIRSIPTFVVLKNNDEVWRNTGMMTDTSLLDILTSLR